MKNKVIFRCIFCQPGSKSVSEISVPCTLHHNNQHTSCNICDAFELCSTGSWILLNSVRSRKAITKNRIEFDRGCKLLGTSWEALVPAWHSYMQNHFYHFALIRLSTYLSISSTIKTAVRQPKYRLKILTIILWHFS